MVGRASSFWFAGGLKAIFAKTDVHFVLRLVKQLYYPAYRRMGLYVKLRLYSNSWRMCLHVKYFIISGNKKAVTLKKHVPINEDYK